MKLTTSQVEQLQGETHAQVVPRGEPAAQLLLGHFGDHTFFVNGDGLHIWEIHEDDDTSARKLVAIQLATWSDEDRSALVPHEPKPIKVVPASDSRPPHSAA